MVARSSFKAVRWGLAAALVIGLPVATSVADAAPVVVDGSAQADARLAAIGYRLARANGGQCSAPSMMTGFILHDVGGYAAADRARVARAYGLTTGFGVLAITPGSAADRAGFAVGDEIVAVNVLDTASFGQDAIGRSASYARTERFVTALDQTLRGGPAAVLIRRGDATRTITLTGDAGCGGQFTVQPGGALNAWSDGAYVAVTTRLMASVGDDDQLAFVVAHEMAHNILGHRERLAGKSALFASFGFKSGAFKETEIEADRFAINLMVNAGFAPEAADRFLEGSASVRWMDLPITHPGIRRRVQLVDAAIATLREQRMAMTLAAKPAILFAARAVPANREFASLVAVPTMSLLAPPVPAISYGGGWPTAPATVMLAANGFDPAAFSAAMPSLSLVTIGRADLTLSAPDPDRPAPTQSARSDGAWAAATLWTTPFAGSPGENTCVTIGAGAFWPGRAASWQAITPSCSLSAQL